MLRGIGLSAGAVHSATTRSLTKSIGHKIWEPRRVRVIERRRRYWLLDDAPEVRSQLWQGDHRLVRRWPGAEGTVVGYLIRDGELSALVVEHENGSRGAYWLGEVAAVTPQIRARRQRSKVVPA
jgi:hypothetical protein